MQIIFIYLTYNLEGNCKAYIIQQKELQEKIYSAVAQTHLAPAI